VVYGKVVVEERVVVFVPSAAAVAPCVFVVAVSFF